MYVNRYTICNLLRGRTVRRAEIANVSRYQRTYEYALLLIMDDGLAFAIKPQYGCYAEDAQRPVVNGDLELLTDARLLDVEQHVERHVAPDAQWYREYRTATTVRFTTAHGVLRVLFTCQTRSPRSDVPFIDHVHAFDEPTMQAI